MESKDDHAPFFKEEGHYKVVISNVYADDNRGGAALTEAAITLARSALPGCHVTLLAVSGNEDSLRTTHRHTRTKFPEVEILPPVVAVKKGRLGGVRAAIRSALLLWGLDSMGEAKAVRCLREADIVIGKGGQVFSSRRGLRALLGLWLALFPQIYARFRKTPCSLLGITIGPYQRWQAARILAGWVLRRVDAVLVRDSYSLAEAQRLGVHASNTIQAPDTVFALQRPSQGEVNEVVREHGLDSVRYGALTIAVKSETSDRELIEFFSKVIADVLERSIVDEVVVVLQVDGTVSSDRRISEALVVNMGNSRVWLIDKDMKPSDLIALYAGAKFTLGSRVHSTIFSIIAGTPAFPVAPRGKVKALSIYSTLGLGDYVISFDMRNGWANKATSSVADKIEKAVSREQESREEMLAAADAARQGQGGYVQVIRSLAVQ